MRRFSNSLQQCISSMLGNRFSSIWFFFFHCFRQPFGIICLLSTRELKFSTTTHLFLVFVLFSTSIFVVSVDVFTQNVYSKILDMTSNYIFRSYFPIQNRLRYRRRLRLRCCCCCCCKRNGKSSCAFPFASLV